MKFITYYGISKDAKYGESFMERFPILFQNRKHSMQETCMCWGIECPLGWWHILDQLCTYLEFKNMEFTKNYGIAVIADQVKEKFGTLRFYYTIRDVNNDGIASSIDGDRLADDERKHRIAVNYLEMLAQEAIDEAENMTENTCAECGVPLDKENKVETRGWISYICKECDEERQIKSVEEDKDEEPAGKDSKD